jgi:hypothetical protein
MGTKTALQHHVFLALRAFQTQSLLCTSSCIKFLIKYKHECLWKTQNASVAVLLSTLLFPQKTHPARQKQLSAYTQFLRLFIIVHLPSPSLPLANHQNVSFYSLHALHCEHNVAVTVAGELCPAISEKKKFPLHFYWTCIFAFRMSLACLCCLPSFGFFRLHACRAISQHYDCVPLLCDSSRSNSCIFLLFGVGFGNDPASKFVLR